MIPDMILTQDANQEYFFIRAVTAKAASWLKGKIKQPDPQVGQVVQFRDDDGSISCGLFERLFRNGLTLKVGSRVFSNMEEMYTAAIHGEE
jgi:hypothetical protein